MNESKATRYQRLRRRADISVVLSSGVALGVLAFTPASTWLRNLSDRLVADLPGALQIPASFVLFVFFVSVVWEAASLPLALRGARIAAREEKSFNADQILWAHLQAGAVACGGTLIAAAVIVVSTITGAVWWLVAACGLALLWAALLGAWPTALALVSDIRPIRRPALRARLEELARQVRVPVAGIHEWAASDGPVATALVAGVGRSRRIFISSALVRDWSDDEVAVVVAHELAHHAHHDLWRSFALNVLLLGSGLGLAQLSLNVLGERLGFAGPADPAALPLVALCAGLTWAIAAPLRHAQSRAQERRADLFALRATRAIPAFQAAIRRLGAQHLAEERPSRLTRWFHHRHPSVAERLELAEKMALGSRL
jgi:STE24 endopeptidase